MNKNVTLLVDLNNITMSKLFSKHIMEKDGYNVESINYDFWKYGVFSAIYGYMTKYSNVDEVVLAADSSQSWRKLYFPRYKEHRKAAKDKFNIDWQEYQRHFEDLVYDLKAHFPFKVLWTKYCEGDDIIGTVALNRKDKKIVIISSDQDYLQLCRNGVRLFSIQKQEEMSHPNPEMFLKEASLMGQQKDGIFNVLTPLDYPVELRKPPFGKKKAEKFLIEGLENALNNDVEYKRKYTDADGKAKIYNSKINLQERYEFNRNLMDFSKIPQTIKEKILKNYYNYEYPHPEKIYEFFKKMGWPYFLDNLTAVENRLYELYKSEK